MLPSPRPHEPIPAARQRRVDHNADGEESRPPDLGVGMEMQIVLR